MVSDHGLGTCSLRPYIEEKFADMYWLHNRTTIPTFLPPRPTITKITTIYIGPFLQEYRNLRGDIHEWYYFQEYIVNYGFRHKKENVNSLRDNQQSTSLEEHEMRKSSYL